MWATARPTFRRGLSRGTQTHGRRMKVGQSVTAGPGIGLTLCMIVRDEEKMLAACLRSVRDTVDQMVVVDTGSRDATVQAARAAGAEVHTFSWCDDFAAA